ncbi:MAG: PorP/SprF family type IX secretion system membrane protein [Chitinophagales bacterium]|nr:PorP/SprF family type IX secretion system membrane protein [Chitinophagales bacterium]
MKKVILALAFLWTISAKAQDVHFSNFNAQPLLLNPALSGLNGCDWRVGANFRTQWLGVSQGNTYRTASVFSDFALGKPTKYSNFAGMGLSFISDQAGDLNYNTNRIDFSLAYHLMLKSRARQSISFGLQGGFAHRGFNQSKALFEFDPISGEPVLSAVENFDASTRMYGDAALGVLYSASPRDNSNFYAGFALQHVNQPNISSFNINRDQSERLYMKFTFHGGALIPLSEQVSLMPSYLVLKQGPSYEINVSSYIKYKFSSIPAVKTAIYFGAMYRVLDAVILGARADIKGAQIHFSYDLNLSKLTSASRANGGPEIAVIYTGCFNRKNNDRYCPAF